MSYVSEILLFLFILNLGTAFGAGLYETRIVVPQWFSKSSEGEYSVNGTAMQKLDSGMKFWAFVTTGPLTLLTLANLVVAWQSQQPVHDWWLTASLLMLLERIGTFSFFIPTAIRLQKADTLQPSRMNRLAMLWIRLNYGRNVLTLIAWIAALIALAK